MQVSVFYSWQSDLPASTNRSYVLKALERACKTLRKKVELLVEPVVDRDTASIPGAPDISRSIFAKIDKAAVFVGDVSIISAKSSPRATPNPNVLIELGYALNGLGERRIIQVMNTAYGRPELLPFDLRNRRTVTYVANETDDERAPERKKLESTLRSHLESILTEFSNEEVVDDAKRATSLQLSLQRTMAGDTRSIQLDSPITTVPGAARRLADALSQAEVSWLEKSPSPIANELGRRISKFLAGWHRFLLTGDSIKARLGRLVRSHNYESKIDSFNDPSDRAFVLGRLLEMPDGELSTILDIPAAGRTRLIRLHELVAKDEQLTELLDKFRPARLAVLEGLIQVFQPLTIRYDP